MVLYLIGLGLGDEKDITVRGLETVKRCAHVFLEHYTAILGSVPLEQLEAFYGRRVTLADREMVESQAEEIIRHAKDEEVAFLVVGDPFAATTHHDLLLRAAEEGIKVETIHNASIMNAVAQVGLQLYQFGQTVSICFFRDEWRPDSFYDKIKINMQNEFHTLCLLDIKVKEQSFENMAKGIKVYEPPRYMTVNQAVEQLLEIEDKRKEKVYSRDTLAFGVARLGHANQQIVSGTLSDLLTIDFGGPLHSLVLAAPTLHEVEQSMWELHHWDRARREVVRKREKAEREAREAEEERARLERMAAERAANPPPVRDTKPKAKAPVKASASAPSNRAESSDDEEEMIVDPLF